MKHFIAIFSVAFVTIALLTQVVQAKPGRPTPTRVFYVTTVEPETKREGTLDPPDWQGNDFTPIPDDPDRYPPGAYIQEFTPNNGDDNVGDWKFARYAWSHTSMVVNARDVVTIEFYGVKGTNHLSQLFIGTLGQLGERPGPAGLTPVNDCVVNDPSPPTDEASLDPANCRFSVGRGELTTVTFTAETSGAILLHCHTHGPTMNAYINVLRGRQIGRR